MTLALLALFAALALFWLSTRQWPTLVRLAIWIAGVALLGSVALDLSTPGGFGLRQAIADAWANRSDPSNAAVTQALLSNAQIILRFISQLWDFFVVATVIVGVLALIALRRGERLEHFLRPSILMVAGTVAGSVATLAIVAIGLGGQIKPRTFLGVVPERSIYGEESIYDGDTFWLGEVSLRLWGVDAPDMNQSCRGVENCGELARSGLRALLVENLVQCEQKTSESGRTTESFGRPLVECWVRRDGQKISVGEHLIREGLAIPYRSDSNYGYDGAAQIGQDHGVMRGCSLRPDVWRARDDFSRAARIVFERGEPIPQGVPTMGACSAELLSP